MSDLATAILSYITTNYSSATIVTAHKESDGVFEVYIIAASGARLELKFTAGGVFLSVRINH